MDEKDRATFINRIEDFRFKVKDRAYENLIVIKNNGRIVGRMFTEQKPLSVKPTKKMKKVAESGKVLLSGHNHAISQSPLVSVEDVKLMLEDLKSKYGVATTNGNGIGVIRNGRINRTEKEINAIKNDLDKYSDKMWDDFHKRKGDFLKVKKEELYNTINDSKEYKKQNSLLIKREFAKFKLENADEYAKKLNDVLVPYDMKFKII